MQSITQNRESSYARTDSALSAKAVAATMAPAQVLRALASGRLDDHDGLSDNASLAAWYTAELSRLMCEAAASSGEIWADGNDIGERRAALYASLRAQPRNHGFFLLRDALDAWVEARYIDARHVPSRALREARSAAALWPRDMALRPLFRQFGRYVRKAGFKQEVYASLGRLPRYVHGFLRQQGYQFRLGRMLGDIEREYLRKAEFFEGRPFEDAAAGAHVAEGKFIDLPFFIRGERGLTPAHDRHTNDLPLVIAHEAGHAMLAALADLADSLPVTWAYHCDLTAMFKRAHDGIRSVATPDTAYFLPKAFGGSHPDADVARNEALVEMMAEQMLVEAASGRIALGLSMPATFNQASHAINLIRTDMQVFPTGLEFPHKARVDAALRAKAPLPV